MIKISKRRISNIAFALLIGLMIYPPTKVYFIRLFSFAPSIQTDHSQKKLVNTNWSLKGLNTKNINLTDVDKQVVFVSFWATWCPPCIAEMPSMKTLYKDYKKDVVFLFITNENWNTVAKFYDRNTYSFPTYNQQSQAPKEFEHSSIPATYILSRDNCIAVDKKGAANWNSNKVRELLDTLVKQKNSKIGVFLK